jgi:capsid protein
VTNEIKPNLIDKMIGVFSPRAMAERVQYRAYMASPQFSASYSGGVSTRLSTKWGQASSYIGGTQSERRLMGSMRDRARRVYANSYIGRSLIDTETDYVIGDGMTLQARTSSDDFNRVAEDRFSAWLDVADVRGMMGGCDWQRMIYRTSRVDGDAGVVLVDRGGESRIQIIPGDRITNPDGRHSPNIFDGVEASPVGRPTRFHILSETDKGARSFESISADNFKYLSWIAEPLQIRGETCYAQVFQLLDQLDGYTDAVVVAARMGAIFGLIFKEKTAAKQFGALGTIANAKGDQQKAFKLENGMVKFIGGEDDVVQVQASQPMSQTPDFIRAMLRLIGLPFGMPLEIAAKDVSTSNLSALRGVRQEYASACKPKQRRFIFSILTPIYRWWISREVKAGRITGAPEDFATHEWLPHAKPMTDPITETQALILECEANVNTWDNVCSILGRDRDQIIEANRIDREKREVAGVPDIRSTYTRDPVASQPNPADDTETEDTDDGEETNDDDA